MRGHIAPSRLVRTVRASYVGERPLSRKAVQVKTTKGKVTTTKAQFLSLAKGVKEAERSALVKWLDAYRVFVKDGSGDVQAWAEAWVRAVRGSDYDTNTPGTVRMNVGLIKWAEENIIGGANACKSMAHIIASKKPKPTKQATKQYKVSTVTITNTEFARALRKAGIAPELIALAEKAVFVTK